MNKESKLSIKEKAEAYDRSLERAKVWKYKSGLTENELAILYDIFPVLKISESEIIKKWLLEFIPGMPDKALNSQSYNLRKDQVLAWIKSQNKLVPEAVKEEKIDNTNYVELARIKEVHPKLHVGGFICIESLVHPIDGDEDELQELNIRLDNFQALCLTQRVLSALKINSELQLGK